MWDAEKDNDIAFEQRVDSLCREIGDRGKPVLPESVPPVTAMTSPAPAPAPVPIPAQAPAPTLAAALARGKPVLPESVLPVTAMTRPAPAPAPVPIPAQAPAPTLAPTAATSRTSRTLSASLQPSPSSSTAVIQQSESRIGDSVEMASATNLLREQREEILAQRREIDRLREEIVAAHIAEAARPKLAVEVVSEQQLASLQSRVEALHASSLLSDDELFVIEDSIVDCIGMLSEAVATSTDVDKVVKMISISEKVASDRTLARQLRRKYC
jgi:flagellar biosynthesis protein FlhF